MTFASYAHKPKVLREPDGRFSVFVASAYETMDRAAAETMYRLLGESLGVGPTVPGTTYTYDKQPGNVETWRLGEACSQAAKDSAGDYIDRGLSLLHRLAEKGFGVFKVEGV